jgi:hypothetical protein
MLLALSMMFADPGFEGEETFRRLVQDAHRDGIQQKSTGERVAYFGRGMVGKPYVGGTLDTNPTAEACYVSLERLDCVTFMETALGMARINFGKRSAVTREDLIRNVEFTRYRGGRVGGYLSRLHYTSDWIADNVKKGVVEDLSKTLPGATKLQLTFDFMSRNYTAYAALKANPDLLPELKEIEAKLTAMDKWMIPSSLATLAEKFLRSGDIVAIVDKRPGLDYAHVGMIIVEEGVPHFVHASSVEKKVVVGVRLSEYLKRQNNERGFSVVRPI